MPLPGTASLHRPEAEYLCERTVMIKKVKTSEMSSPTSSPRKIAEEKVTIQTTLWERVGGERDLENEQNGEGQAHSASQAHRLPTRSPRAPDHPPFFLSHEINATVYRMETMPSTLSDGYGLT